MTAILIDGKAVAADLRRKLSVVIDTGARGNDYLASSVQRSCPDIGRIRGLGWEPTTGLSDGFRRTVQTYL